MTSSPRAPVRTRIDALVDRAIADFELDLSGLVVLTEAASGPYLHTPLLAALAGAERVYAVTADSRYATGAEVRVATEAEAERRGVAGVVEVLDEREPRAVAAADIVTNSGFVRPIDAALVAQLKPTAVVPLMWETWEVREGEVDFDACRAHGVLVLGTDEAVPALSMEPWAGFLAMKLLFELGLEGYRSRVVLLGGQEMFGRSVWKHLRAVGIEVAWFAEGEPEARPYAEAAEFLRGEGRDYDALLVFEHEQDLQLVGDGGVVESDDVPAAMAVGVMTGRVDADALRARGVNVVPEVMRPFRYETYETFRLGPRPVLDLYAAGLKVGEAMARARLAGMDLEAATAHALAHSPAMAFPESA
jgi:hypothetical protein